MKIGIEYEKERIIDIVNIIYNSKLLLHSDYAYSGCWTLDRQLEVIHSINMNFPIGTIWLQKLDIETFPKYLLLDGVQRIQAIINVLTGKGFYFDFEKGIFTTDKTKFAHSNLIETFQGSVFFYDWKENGLTLEQAKSLHTAIRKVLESEVFVSIFSHDTDSHEILKRMNKVSELSNKKKWYIGNLQPIKIETLVK